MPQPTQGDGEREQAGGLQLKDLQMLVNWNPVVVGVLDFARLPRVQGRGGLARQTHGFDAERRDTLAGAGEEVRPHEDRDGVAPSGVD
jgi:hypothetical protein